MTTIKQYLLHRERRLFYCVLLFLFIGYEHALAQSNEKEGANSFALYTKTGDFGALEKAKNFSDNAYKTRKDSSSHRNNLLRALVYSSLSVADSNRKIQYSQDPIDITKSALLKLNDKQFNYENEAQLIYINRKLGNAHLILGNTSLRNNKLEEAYSHFKEADLLSKGDINVNHNLSVISSRLNRNDEAVLYFKRYLASSGSIKPDDILALAHLYSKASKPNEELNTLLNGRETFPQDKNILFQILNIYAANGSFEAIIPLIDIAYKLEPKSKELNYLAGYAYEVTGNRKLAEQYYQNVLKLDDNNYDANFELGLIYLKDYVRDTTNMKSYEYSERYLLKANEIDPNSINALKSLAILFDKSGNTIQYERVKNQLNQNTFN